MRLFLFAFLLFSLAACGPDDEGTSTNCTSSVDQAEVLFRYSEIITRRVGLTFSTSNGLKSKAQFYADVPSEANLEGVKRSFIDLTVEWMKTEPYSFGPDGSLQTALEVNPFPIDEAAVDVHFNARGFDASLPLNFDRGLPALEYLLFNGTTAEVHQRFQVNPGSTQIILDFIDAFQAQVLKLSTVWNDAEADFRINTGTSAGSGISVLINSLSKHFEDTRRDRLGTPFGVTTLGFPNLQTVEAPYSARSLELLALAVKSSQSAFFATDVVGNQNLPSLADYLRGLPSADAATLVDDIESQYTLMLTTLDEIDGSLKVAVEQDRDDVQEAYNAISRQVVNLKTDVPAVACVAITYVDNPSDSD
ncbi:MAG: imelysin family protein [Saprospiraceae bacterium]